MGLKFYTLRNGNAVEVDQLTWGMWSADLKHRIVAKTTLPAGAIEVSTVFIGLDNEFYESMVFGGPFGKQRRRYNTYGEAKRGHFTMVDEIRVAIQHT
jgi:hypothetical protein